MDNFVAPTPPKENNLDIQPPKPNDSQQKDQGVFDKAAKLKKSPKKIVLSFLVGLIGIALVASLFYYFAIKPGLDGPDYGQLYTLVNDKISKSASIKVWLPKGVSKAEAAGGISFFPEIAGTWVETQDDEALVFKPAEALPVNKYFTAILETASLNIQKDFMIDEDPAIVAAFPAADTEANEHSKVTVVFNRPMIPLTTLDRMYDMDIPVEITPATEGKFKWITTRNLQFIPDNRLQRSSNYTVKINPGFVSMDDLAVEGMSYSFVTRPLRYDHITKGTSIYNAPIQIIFNQPIDLERTIKEIVLKDLTENKDVSFEAEYGTRSIYDRNTKERKELKDRSILEIYLKKDKHGRAKLWNFESSYSLDVKKAYPLEGDINLEEARSTTIQVTDVIKSLSAQSERSSHVELDMFDPQGQLIVEFYEDIDIGKSAIEAKGLKDIQYGEKCIDDQTYFNQNDCQKETDKKKLVLSWHDSKIARAESIEVKFDKIVNLSGFKLNPETIVHRILAYPNLEILKTIPADGGFNADLTKLTICSNTPLTQQTEDIGDFLKVSTDYEFKYWNRTRRIRSGDRDPPCLVGQFATDIIYGLMPETDYRIELKVIDNFSQSAQKAISFKTGKMPSQDLSFTHMQGRYTVTPSDKTKLTYAAMNMEYINMSICKLSAEGLLRYVNRNGTYNQTTALDSSICESVTEKQISLPRRFWIKNYFQVDIASYYPDPKGHYILAFSHPDYRETYSQRRQYFEKTFISVTNLSVVQKEINLTSSNELSNKKINDLSNLYWVVDQKTLQPKSGAAIERYHQDPSNSKELIKSGAIYTDDQGVARAKPEVGTRGLIVKSAGESALIYEGQDMMQNASSASSANRVYIYTDRPIYKPGDGVSLKGLYRVGYDGDYEIFRDNNVKLQVTNSKGEKVYEAELSVGEFGTFDASFMLDNVAALGTYRIQALNAYASFEVEEYVPAAFKLEVESEKEEYINQDTMKLTVNADYYFGVPVRGGEVEYTISSQDYYFDRYQDEYFRFGTNWYRCWYYCSYGEKFILRNKTELSQDGIANIEQKINFQDFFDEDDIKSKIFVVNITVKNENGQSVSTQESFIVHQGEFYLGVKTDKYFVGKNEAFNVKAKSVDTLGGETSVKNIDLRIYKVEWERRKRQEVDGGYYYNWEKVRAEVEQKKISTDSGGNYSGQFSLAEEGQYEVEIKATDQRKNEITSYYNIYVYGEGSVSIKPTTDTRLELETEKNNVEVGDMAKIIIKSPFKKAKALVAIERGEIFESEIIDINSNLYDYQFKIEKEYIPNVYASVLLLSDEPEVKYGQLDFKVNTTQYELDIQATTDKTSYLPGEAVKLKLQTNNYLGQGVPADVSLAVADLSVLALKGNPQKNPLVFFYNGFPLTVSTASNMNSLLAEYELPEGKGGGGMAAAEDNLSKKKRGEFKDTAFWQASVITDENGFAELTFTLPDNLTTWQLESLGITQETLVGVDYLEFMTKKDLMLIPLKPRFIIPGDEFYIGAKVFNQTDEKRKFDVSFASETILVNNDSQKKTITLNADQDQTVYFKVYAPTEYQQGRHYITLSAKDNKNIYEDTVEQIIPITPNDTYEAVATANYTRDDLSEEYVYIPNEVVKDKGGLEVQTSATLAVFISDALNYLLDYPYGCTEQVASRLSAIAIVKRGLNVENVGDKIEIDDIEFEDRTYTIDEVVQIGLAKIYENQATNGAFMYYKSLEPSFHLTLSVVQSLQDLKDAGYQINQSSLDRAVSYLANKITHDEELSKNKSLVVLTAYALSQVDGAEAERQKLKDRVIGYVNDKKFINEEISDLSLSYLAILTAKDYPGGTKRTVYNTIKNRIDIDARGAFLGMNSSNVMYGYYETPIKNTALLLRSFIAHQDEDPIMDKVLRWLLRSRTKDGAWGSTNNTLAVVDAFTEYLIWQRETESEFTLNIDLNNDQLASYDFNADTILDIFGTYVPMSDFKIDTNNKLSLKRVANNELNNNYYYDMLLKYFLPVDKIPPRDEGLSVTRELFAIDDRQGLTPLNKAKQGDVLRGRLNIIVPKAMSFLAIEDYIPAGMELVNFKLSTEDQSLKLENITKASANRQTLVLEDKKTAVEYKLPDALSSISNYFSGLFNTSLASDDDELEYYDQYLEEVPAERQLRPDFVELRNDRLFVFKQAVRPGVYEYDYYVRALTPGKFHHLPAIASQMYFPEIFGRTSGDYFEVEL